MTIFEWRELVVGRIMTGMSWDKATATKWFESDNPLLGNVSPYYMVVEGRGEKLLKFIEGQLAENEGSERGDEGEPRPAGAGGEAE